MKQYFVFIMLTIACQTSLFAQKLTGFGGELSILSVKPTVVVWPLKTMGFGVFGGIAAELDDLKPNDIEVGAKYMYVIEYERLSRLYLGVMGKWKWVNIDDASRNAKLPIPGIFIGKEWFDKRIMRKGFAIELGYQFGQERYSVYDPNQIVPGKYRFEEFPLILNIRYSFYSKK